MKYQGRSTTDTTCTTVTCHSPRARTRRVGRPYHQVGAIHGAKLALRLRCLENSVKIFSLRALCSQGAIHAQQRISRNSNGTFVFKWKFHFSVDLEANAHRGGVGGCACAFPYLRKTVYNMHKAVQLTSLSIKINSRWTFKSHTSFYYVFFKCFGKKHPRNRTGYRMLVYESFENSAINILFYPDTTRLHQIKFTIYDRLVRTVSYET
jgi:hypothetical protein